MEPLWPSVRLRDPEKVGSTAPRFFTMTVAPGRGVREDQWRAALSLAGD